MSFLIASPSIPQPAAPNTLGMRPDRGATHERAAVNRYLAGKNRVAVTWLSDPWSVQTVPVTQSVRKGKRITIGYNYFASFAGLICHAGEFPVDGIYKIYFNTRYLNWRITDSCPI